MTSQWVVCNSFTERDEDADPAYPWYAYLFSEDGVGLGVFPSHFGTEKACRNFINDYVLGATLEEPEND